MIFLTVVFMIYYLAIIIKGNLYYDLLKENNELLLKSVITEDIKEKKEFDEIILKNSLIVVIAVLVLVITMVGYLFKAITIDPNKYPSILMLFYSLLSSLIFNKNNIKYSNGLTNEEGKFKYKTQSGKVKKYTFKGFIIALIHLSYFTYMFYVLVLK